MIVSDWFLAFGLFFLIVGILLWFASWIGSLLRLAREDKEAVIDNDDWSTRVQPDPDDWFAS